MDKITTVPASSNINNKQIDNTSNSKPCHCPQEKLSVVSLVCRICYDDNRQEPIITPCHCKGTVAFIHRSCLETWLAESNTTSCELCHYVYHTERTPKYTAKQSIWRWFRYPPNNIGFQIRGLRNDLFACALLTPLAIVITYVCLFSADYYNQQKFSNIPAARWTSVSLLVMIAIMLVGYYLWVYMVIRYHGRVWYYWWQRECVVRYVAPSSLNVCCNDNHDNTGNEENVHNDEEVAISVTNMTTDDAVNTINENVDNESQTFTINIINEEEENDGLVNDGNEDNSIKR